MEDKKDKQSDLIEEISDESIVDELPIVKSFSIEDESEHKYPDHRKSKFYVFTKFLYIFLSQAYDWKEFFVVLPTDNEGGKIANSRLADHYIYTSIATIVTLLNTAECKIPLLKINFSDTAGIKAITRGRYLYQIIKLIIGNEQFIEFLNSKNILRNKTSFFLTSTIIGILSTRWATHTMKSDIKRIKEENNLHNQENNKLTPYIGCSGKIHQMLCLSLISFPISDIIDFFNVLSQELASNPINSANTTNITDSFSAEGTGLTPENYDQLSLVSSAGLALLSGYFFVNAYNWPKLIDATYKSFSFIGSGARTYGACSNLFWTILTTLTTMGLTTEENAFSSDNIRYFILTCMTLSLANAAFSFIETSFDPTTAYYENNEIVPSFLNNKQGEKQPLFEENNKNREEPKLYTKTENHKQNDENDKNSDITLEISPGLSI